MVTGDAVTAPARASDSLGTWARRYYYANRRAVETLLKVHGIGSTQWLVLRHLAAAGPTAQRDLGSVIEAERAALSGIVSTLVGKVDIRHVPFTGAGPAMNAVTAGHVQLGVVAMTPAIELVKAGKLKGYAITATKRTPELPDVPTMAETGIGQVDDATWIALFVPAKTPDAIVAKINADANAALKNSATVQLINRAGMSPLGGSLEELNAYVSNETKKWEEVVRAVGLKAEESK